MNDLLFYALLIALLYYFFIYLPSQKKLLSTSPSPLFDTKQTQTEIETIIETEPGSQFVEDPQELARLKKDIQQKERTIIGLNQSYEKLETKTKKETDNLKEQLKDKETKLKELWETEKVIESLIKNIQELEKELC